MRAHSQMFDTEISIDQFIDRLENILDERKCGRRKRFDPASPYSSPERDRRSGKDRRKNYSG